MNPWPTPNNDNYDYLPIRLPAHLARLTASARLAIHAEFTDWELSRVRAYTDGTRRVLLRRKKTTPTLGPHDTTTSVE